MNQKQWNAEERRKLREREALLKLCKKTRTLFIKGAEVATRTKPLQGG